MLSPALLLLFGAFPQLEVLCIATSALLLLLLQLGWLLQKPWLSLLLLLPGMSLLLLLQGMSLLLLRRGWHCIVPLLLQLLLLQLLLLLQVLEPGQ